MVTGAAGAVGSDVGQIAKIKGCRGVGMPACTCSQTKKINKIVWIILSPELSLL